MDFDLSLMVPHDVNLKKYRRPYQESFMGSYLQPRDTSQGEFDYNPFVFDVGCLGVMICMYYQVRRKDLDPFIYSNSSLYSIIVVTFLCWLLYWIE